MSPSQRAAAERLAFEQWYDAQPDGRIDPWDVWQAATLLRELAAEPVQEPGVEYKRGYEEALNDCIRNGGEAWARSMFANNAEHIKPVQAPSPLAGTMAEQFLQVVAGIWHDHPDYSIRQTLDALNAKFPAEPVQEPVAWRSKTRVNGEFDSGWHLTSTEPPQTPRTIAIEPLYTAPQQQRRPLTELQIDRLDRQAIHGGPDSQYAFRFTRLIERAHGITGEPT